MEVISNSTNETEKFGKKLGSFLFKGAIVVLSGELGSGKTTFIKGVVSSFDFDRNKVKSQSFVLINEYPTKIPIYHMDFYRMSDLKKIYDLDWDFYFDNEHIILIEWAEKIEKILDNEYLKIEIFIVSENTRGLKFIPHCEKYRRILEKFSKEIFENNSDENKSL
jgi:tRNA threonylcarbamoyladenosine biosynthesis protein TsaE